jgi:hypothetical protein
VSVSTEIVVAAAGLAAGVAGTAYKSRKALEQTYDIDLRKSRIDAYRMLWKALQPLARYAPPSERLEPDDLRRLAVTLRRWYFEGGGLFLSKAARNAYFDLQETLAQTIAQGLDPESVRPLLRRLGSDVRSAMAADVATRVAPRLGGGRSADVDVPDEVRERETADALEAAVGSGSQSE